VNNIIILSEKFALTVENQNLKDIQKRNQNVTEDGQRMDNSINEK